MNQASRPSVDDGPATSDSLRGGQPLIEAKDLRVVFEVNGRQLVAVDGVDIAVQRGETVGLVGESGSGKSTIAKALMRAYEPQGGVIRFDGWDVSHSSERQLRKLRRHVQMVQQDPYSSLNPHMSTASIVAEPLRAFGWGDRESINARVKSLIDEVGLGEAALARRPAEFSGGQRQRIAIARALAIGPDLVIADEPLSALDVSIQAQIINLFQDMREIHDVSYLIISHDLTILNQIADRIVVLYLGKVVEEGPTSEVFERPRHPYTVALLSAMPAAHSAARSERVVLNGDPPSPLAKPTGCHFHTRCPIARQRCSAESPPMQLASAGHRAACFYPGELELHGSRAGAAYARADQATAIAASIDPPAEPPVTSPGRAGKPGGSDDGAAELLTVASSAAGKSGWRHVLTHVLLRRAIQLVITVAGVTTVLFFLLRLTGDPAKVIAGENSSAQQLALISKQYGLNLPLAEQYLHFLRMVAVLNFGNSYVSYQPALGEVWQRLWLTVGLTMAAMLINVVISVVLGCVIGASRSSLVGRVTAGAVFVAQGVPFYLVGLILIEVFSVTIHLLPSIGASGFSAWIMPSLTLAWFLAPRLTRVIAVNVSAAMQQEYVQVARAAGAPKWAAVLRHALPNALVAATALAGTQLAYLISGTLIVEEIFSWPGLGQLLVNSIISVDFPVVEASVFVIAVFVYVVNALTDVLLTVIDPRIRR
jgi:oligopeptide/dipeptide ABC transporter ATP-binding protein